MFLLLSKLLPPLLLYPPGMTLVLVLLAALLRKRRPKLAAGLLCFALGSLYLLSTEALAENLMGGLEAQYPPVDVDREPAADAIVVLGGYLHSPTTKRPWAELTEGGDRLWMAAKLYRSGKAPLVLLSGGNVPMFGDDGLSEAQGAKGILVQWGVPDAAILLEQDSKNTRENATNSMKILAAHGARHLLLVTSAYHMPRAVAIFHRVGGDVTPVPTDYQAGWSRSDALFRWIPGAEQLVRSQAAVKEWIGLTVYRLRGWA